MLEILAPGPLATLQDGGRWGAQWMGIGVGGAMDAEAARVANILLDNSDDASVLELTAGGAEMVFREPAVVVLSGADLDATLDGAALPLCAPVTVRAAQVLRLGRARIGWRVVLAIAGGFAAERVFGSVATDLRGAFGGHDGRALRRGDRVGFAASAWRGEALPRIGCPLANPAVRTRSPLGLIAGPVLEELTNADRERLLGADFHVSREADRMGLRLEEALVSAASLPQQVSTAVVAGAVQLPPDGRPIILGVDRQTTGGYPLAGVIAAVDHWQIAQLRPGDALRLRLCSIAEARRALGTREQQFVRLRIAAAAAWRGRA